MSTEETAKAHTMASLYPTYALRAWLTALQLQTQRAQSEIQASIQSHESEIARLRQQFDHAGGVVKSLEHAIERVDATLQRRRDVDATRKPDTGSASAANSSHEDSTDTADAQKKKNQ
jgi:site-specific recombinase